MYPVVTGGTHALQVGQIEPPAPVDLHLNQVVDDISCSQALVPQARLAETMVPDQHGLSHGFPCTTLVERGDLRISHMPIVVPGAISPLLVMFLLAGRTKPFTGRDQSRTPWPPTAGTLGRLRHLLTSPNAKSTQPLGGVLFCQQLVFRILYGCSDTNCILAFLYHAW